jgi:small-conductance mechanosensitive channel
VRGTVAPLVGLFAIGLLRELVPPFTVPARLLLLAQALLGALWLFRRFAPERLARLGARPGTVRPLAFLGHAAGATLLAAAIADVAGAMALAVMLLEGVFFALYVALAVYTVQLLLDGLVVGALGLPALQRLRTVQRHAPGIQRRALRLVHVLLAAVWVAALLTGFSLLDPVRTRIAEALAAPLAVGEVDFSLGAVVSFVVTLAVVVAGSRMVRTVLDEDVLGRLDLPTGVPAAISSGVTYLLVLGGFLFATAAAGFGMERVALIVSALGVGIGFGLQTVVNNFVSGLILLFERPIRAGDIVNVGTLTGEVLHIGIRASTVRTFDGAEVIVPNGTLLADKVVNWTLSDQRRRMDVPVGIAYGTKPQTVVALLQETARTHPDVLAHPAPQALFLGFGANALDFVLRAWTVRRDHAVVRSELAMAVAEAVTAAGLEIPFPQQDLHVRSLAPDVAAALGARAATSPPAD